MANKPVPAGHPYHDIKDPNCVQRNDLSPLEEAGRKFRRESGRTCPVCALAEKPKASRTRRRATKAASS